MAPHKVIPFAVPAQDPRTTQDPPMRSALKNNLALLKAFDSWMMVGGYSPHTRRAYNRVLADFADFVKSEDLTEINHLAVRQYLGHLHERGCSSSTLARQIYALRTFFKTLQRAGVMDRFRLVAPRRVPKRLPRVLTEEEVTRLIEGARTPRDRAALEFFYATGCRLSEVTGLRVEEIDFRHRTARVVGKGNKERIVCFGKPAARLLRKHLGDRETGFVFEGPGGKAIDPRNINRMVKSTGLRVGLDVHPHLLNRGMNIRYVQELLGHSSISTTQIYTHVAMADLSRAIERFHPRGR